LEGATHICPNCGQLFNGHDRDVFCSFRCARQLRKDGRYPTLGALPLDERNRVAELIALVRSARRQIDRSMKADLYPPMSPLTEGAVN